MYEIYRHFHGGQDKETEKETLHDALRYMYEEAELSADNGHAVSVRNDSGSVFEINYWGNVEIDVDNCATKEELAQIKSYVTENGLCWNPRLDEKLFKHLSSCADFNYLLNNLSQEALLLLEGIIEAYVTGRIGLEIIRGEDEQIDFDKSFGLIINDESYVPFEDGLDVTAIKWYESFEDTGYLWEELLGYTAHELEKYSFDNRVRSALARAADAQQTDHAKAKVPEPVL